MSGFSFRRLTFYLLTVIILSVLSVSLLAAHPVFQEATSCPGALASRLVVGEQGRVGPGGANNVRSEAATSGQLLGQIPGGGAFIVLEGPVCGEGFAWWRVDYNGLTGWTAEGQGTDYWLEPAGPLPTQAPTLTAFPTATPEFPQSAACPGFMPSRLIVGEQGRVVPGPSNNLRAEPASDTQLLAEIPGGARFLVLEGPICAAGLAWWRVDYYGKVGWTPEGSKNTYWLEPAGPVPTPAPTLTPSITPTPYPTYTPSPTYTPVPAMPPVLAFGNLDRLLTEPLPASREAVTAENVHLLKPVSIIGQGGINQVVVAPDGKTVAVQNGIGVWLNTLGNMNQPGILLNTSDLAVTAMAFNVTSEILAIGGNRYDGMAGSTLQFWNTQTGERLPFHRQFSDSVQTMAFSSDGRLAVGASSGRNGWYGPKGLLLGVSSESIQTIPEDFGSVITSITISPDRSMIAASTDYGTITVYNLASRKHQINYEVEGRLGDLLFSADGGLLLSAGGGGEATTPGVLRVWDLTTSERIASPRFPQQISQLTLSPNGEIVAVMPSYGDRIWLWNLVKRDEPSELRLSMPATGVVFGDNEHLIVTHADSTAREWDIQNGENVVMLDYSGVEQNDRVAISPNGNLLALADYEEREIRLWDNTTRSVTDTFSDDNSAVSYMDFDQDGVELHLQTGNRRYIWNLETGSKEPTATVFTPAQTQNDALMNLARSFYPGQHSIYSVTAVPNSSLMLVNDGYSLTFWNVNTRLPLASMRFFGTVVGFSADGSVLLTQTSGAYWLWAVAE